MASGSSPAKTQEGYLLVLSIYEEICVVLHVGPKRIFQIHIGLKRKKSIEIRDAASAVGRLLDD